MADHTAYPDSLNLSTFLAAHHLDVSRLDTATLEDAISAGINDVERATGRTFVAASASRLFDPPQNPNGILDLRADLVAVTSISYQGTAMVDGTDFYAEPYDAPAKGQPYNRIRFVRRIWYWPIDDSLRRSITVTGTWGYGATIPATIWNAMLAAGGIQLLPALIHAVAAGLVRWTEADVTEEYGPKPFAYLADGWGAILARADWFKRVTVGLGF